MKAGSILAADANTASDSIRFGKGHRGNDEWHRTAGEKANRWARNWFVCRRLLLLSTLLISYSLHTLFHAVAQLVICRYLILYDALPEFVHEPRFQVVP